MVKKIAVVLFLSIVVYSCGGVSFKNIDSKNYAYRKGVEFNVKISRDDKSTPKGDYKDSLYVAPDNTVFKVLILEFSNPTDKDIEIDFKDFILLDNNDSPYEPVSVVQLYTPMFDNTFEKFKQILKAGKTKTFQVIYWPPFPKSELVTKMLINNVPISIGKI